MDAMRAHAVVVDAHGFPAGFRRGFCFADSKHHDAAAQRYLQRKIDLHNASHVDHNPTPSLDKLRALADRAYEDRKQRMANAWRTDEGLRIPAPNCSASSPRSSAQRWRGRLPRVRSSRCP